MRKEASELSPAGDEDEILPEYDLTNSRPNPYTGRYAAGARAVVLDADVARVFPNAAAVNEALRALAGIIERRSRAA